MKTTNNSSPSLRRYLLLMLLSFGILGGAAFAQTPAGDLTLVVQELANGDVEFSLSGTVTSEGNGSPNKTPDGDSEPLSTIDDYETYTIPDGMTLTAPGGSTGLTFLEFNTNFSWNFGNLSLLNLAADDAIAGSGSSTSNEVPFSNFEVGTYEVSSGFFTITYIVRAFAGTPEVSAPRVTSFPTTEARRSSRVSRISIENVGQAAVTDLQAQITGRSSRDFRIRGRVATSIGPGDSTFVRVYFRPRRFGNKRAILQLRSNAPTERARLAGRSPRPPETIIAVRRR